MKKVIIVTGASRGIGRAIVEELSKDNIVVANLVQTFWIK